MAQLLRPGGYVDEVLNPPPVVQGDLVNDNARACFLGPAIKGPVNPTFCPTWTDYMTRFGGFDGDFALPYAVYSYFTTGTGGCWVLRPTGAGAVAASVSLSDRGAGPAPQLTVEADSPGTWGNALRIGITDVLDRLGVATGRFNLTVFSGGTTPSNIVETWLNLSMGDSDERYAPAIINPSDTNEGSAYINVTHVGVLTTAPAEIAGAALTAGADGAAVVGADIAAAVAKLDTVSDSLVLNAPGVSDTTTLNALNTYAENRKDIFCVNDTAMGRSADDAMADAAALLPTSYAAVYHPWIKVPDVGSANRNAVRLIPPGGAVVGRYITTDSERGVFKSPAGIDNRIRSAVATELKYTNTELDEMNTSAAPVNAIRQLPGAGICIMGARTLKPVKPAEKYVATRRTLIYLRREILDMTTYAVFEPNTASLRDDLRSQVNRFLLEFWGRGGLEGRTPQQAYYVKCDASNNTPQDAEQGIVNIEVGVALAYPAEFVVIKLTQFQGGNTTTEG